MKTIILLSLLFCAVDASAVIVKSLGQSIKNAFAEAEPGTLRPVLVVQLPSKIKVVTVAVTGEIKYVSVPKRKRVVVAQ